MIDNEENGVIIENLEEVSTKGKAHIFDKEDGFIRRYPQCSFYKISSNCYSE